MAWLFLSEISNAVKKIKWFNNIILCILCYIYIFIIIIIFVYNFILLVLLLVR